MMEENKNLENQNVMDFICSPADVTNASQTTEGWPCFQFEVFELQTSIMD